MRDFGNASKEAVDLQRLHQGKSQWHIKLYNLHKKMYIID